MPHAGSALLNLPGVTSHWVDIDGPVHYADYGGEGPAMVLAHGLGGSYLNWFLLAPMLRSHFRMLAVDFVGFGRTPRAGRRGSIEVNQAVLDVFIDRVVGEPCALMGHSMGGLISMLQAGRRPESVTELVLVDPAVPPSAESTPVFPAPVARVLFDSPWAASAAGTLVAMVVGPEVLVADAIGRAVADFDALDPRVIETHVALERERLRTGLAYVGYVEARHSMAPLWRDVATFDREVVGAVTAPTLALIGDRDRIIPVPSLRRVRTARPDWRWVEFAGIGHDPIFECPQRVADEIISALP